MNKPKAYDWKGFTDKERLFCYEYLIDKNGTQAAIRAGYSERTADKIAWELLNSPKKLRIRTRIDEMLEETFEKLELSREQIIQELAVIATSDIKELFNDDGSLRKLSEVPLTVRRTISAIDVDELFEGRGEDREHIGYTKKIKLWDKMKALELLGKNLKMWTDKVELNDRPKVYRRDMTGKSKESEASE